MKILVIDDSQDIVGLLDQVLTTVGHEVTTAYTGREGLSLLMSQCFDVVFLDIAMPDFSGLDVIEKLVQEKRIRDSPVVLFTASPITDEEVGRLVEKGVHSILRKPVRLDTLFEKIDEISRMRGLS